MRWLTCYPYKVRQAFNGQIELSKLYEHLDEFGPWDEFVSWSWHWECALHMTRCHVCMKLRLCACCIQLDVGYAWTQTCMCYICIAGCRLACALVIFQAELLIQVGHWVVMQLVMQLMMQLVPSFKAVHFYDVEVLRFQQFCEIYQHWCCTPSHDFLPYILQLSVISILSVSLNNQ